MEELKKMIEGSDNIVFFGGAGTSTESNIPDFRSSNGVYSSEYGGVSPEEILSHDFLYKNPEIFYKFLRDKIYFPDAKPHIGHRVLVKLEQKGKLKGIITQNIDNLHQLAGSKNVVELHGSVYRNYCMKCKSKYSLDYILNSKSNVPVCEKCGGIIRPDVTLYGEALYSNVVNKAVKLISEADMLIVCGTSLIVYPAAGFLRYYNGNKLALVNLSETSYNGVADIVINGSFAKVFGSMYPEN